MYFDAFRVFAVVCVAHLAWPSGSISAQSALAGDTLELSLSAARSLAAEANPELLVAAWRPRAARGDVRAARTVLFNPDLSFENRSPSDGMTSRYEATVGLELEMAGQRGLRGRASEAALSAAYRRLDDDARHILVDVSFAYVKLVAAEQRVALVEEINRLNAQLHAAVRTQLAEGEVSVLEANLVTIEATRATARTMEVSSARQAAALELGRMLGRASTEPVRTVGPAAVPGPPTWEATTLDDHIRTALAFRPDLRALDHDVERAHQEERLARREALPNVRVAGLAIREDPLTDPEWGLSLGVSLPLFNRNQGQGDRLRAEIAGAEQLRRAAELRVRTEVETALLLYESAEREVSLLEAELLGPIRENQRLLATAYREGKLDLSSLLLLRNQLLDAEMSYWDAWERRGRARTELESATGTILDGVSFSNGHNR